MRGELSMPALQKLESDGNLKQVWENSTQKPIVLFKHSATCPVSADAFDELESFQESAADVHCYYVIMSENRDVSNQIAEETEIKHESPQIFLILNKKVVWHTSHSQISKYSITEALNQNYG